MPTITATTGPHAFVIIRQSTADQLCHKPDRGPRTSVTASRIVLGSSAEHSRGLTTMILGRRKGRSTGREFRAVLLAAICEGGRRAVFASEADRGWPDNGSQTGIRYRGVECRRPSWSTGRLPMIRASPMIAVDGIKGTMRRD